VSATLLQGSDLGIKQKVESASTTIGDDASVVLSVTNSGSSQTAVTVTDTIPSGLTIYRSAQGPIPARSHARP
jgi:uncharacterized repeat protein (TIGR01451 family)